MSGFDEFIHQPLRLKIMAALSQLMDAQSASMDFVQLKTLTGATDGNLGAHIAALETAGYVTVVKSFVGKRPNTSVRPTEAGRNAFHAHVRALRAILDQGVGT